MGDDGWWSYILCWINRLFLLFLFVHLPFCEVNRQGLQFTRNVLSIFSAVPPSLFGTLGSHKCLSPRTDTRLIPSGNLLNTSIANRKKQYQSKQACTVVHQCFQWFRFSNSHMSLSACFSDGYWMGSLHARHCGSLDRWRWREREYPLSGAVSPCP